MKYLGIDWGEKRIGLALAEPELRLALPFGTVSNLQELLKVIKEEDVGVLVLGLPLKLSGQKEINSLWQSFKEALERDSSLPLVLVDERLSSRQADSLLGTYKEKASRDEISAALILQSFLDKEIDNH